MRSLKYSNFTASHHEVSVTVCSHNFSCASGVDHMFFSPSFSPRLFHRDHPLPAAYNARDIYSPQSSGDIPRTWARAPRMGPTTVIPPPSFVLTMPGAECRNEISGYFCAND